jgi:hypothetical protein
MLNLEVTTILIAGDGWELRQAVDATAHFHLHAGTLHAVGPAAHVYAIAQAALPGAVAETIGVACGACGAPEVEVEVEVEMEMEAKVEPEAAVTASASTEVEAAALTPAVMPTDSVTGDGADADTVEG